MLSSVAFYWCPSGFDWNSGNHFQWPMIHISNRSSIQTSGKDAAISKVIFSTFFSQSQNRKTKNKNRKKRKKQGKNTCHYSSKSVNPCETSCWWLTDVELRLSVPRCSPTGLRVRPGRKSRSNGSQRINMELFEVMWCFGCVCVCVCGFLGVKVKAKEFKDILESNLKLMAYIFICNITKPAMHYTAHFILFEDRGKGGMRRIRQQ